MKNSKQTKERCFYGKGCNIGNCLNCNFYSEKPTVPEWLIKAIQNKVSKGGLHEQIESNTSDLTDVQSII